MIEVDAGGTIVEFPDGTAPDVMRNALRKKFGSTQAPAEPKAPGEDIGPGMALRGIPVAGRYVPQAEAAIQAAAQPIHDFLGTKGLSEPGATYAERYAATLPKRQAEYAKTEQERPIASGAAQALGGGLALAPLGATALGARALGMAGSIPARLAAGGASGAALSAADAAAGGEDPTMAAIVGGGIGAVAPTIAGGISKAITPFVSREPTRAAAAQVLQAEGVKPTAGQITGSRPLQWAEQHFGELAGVSPSERTAERFTGAALKQVGEDASRATPEVVDRAFTRIGKNFDDLAAKHTLQPDAEMGPRIRKAVDDYQRLVSQPSQIKAITDYEQEIAQALAKNKNALPGEVYQSLRSRMEADARRMGGNEAADALRGMKNALDGAMERQLVRMNSPDAGAWKTARDQYKNLLVIEKAATNPNTKLGLISPATLYSSTKATQGVRNLARGRGDYAPLAQAGSDIMRDLPSSGTAQRMYMQALPGMIGAGVGGIYGGDPYSAVAGGLLGAGGPMLAGRTLMSPAMQRYLANQALTGPGRGALQAGTAGGLLSLQ